MPSESHVPHRYVAFLRAVNVGGRTLKMEHLRGLFEEIGFADVSTFIASGNVIFRTPTLDARTLEARIEDQLKQALGFDVATFLRTPAETADAVTRQPFAGSEGSLYVGFLKAAPSEEAQQRLAALQTATDELRVRGRELYWLCRTSMHESRLSGSVLERTVGGPVTLRNITSLRRLSAKYPAG